MEAEIQKGGGIWKTSYFSFTLEINGLGWISCWEVPSKQLSQDFKVTISVRIQGRYKSNWKSTILVKVVDLLYIITLHIILKHTATLTVDRAPSLVVVLSLSHVRLFATPWTGTCQAPLSMGFSGQEYWNGLLFPSPEDLPNPGMEAVSPAWQADSFTAEPPGKPWATWEALYMHKSKFKCSPTWAFYITLLLCWW